MQGFGFLNNIDVLKNITTIMENVDLVPSDDEAMEQQRKDDLDNVQVPMLSDDKYESTKSVAPIGASGNRPKEDETEEPDAQLELGMGGLNLGMKKEMARTEAFNGTTDEDPMEDAQEAGQKNAMEKVEDLFHTMYGKTYEQKSKEKDPKFYHDFTKPNVVLDNTSMFKVKKGW